MDQPKYWKGLEDSLKIVYAKQNELKKNMEESEVKFWELTKDESRTKDDELNEVKTMMKFHFQLLQVKYLSQFLEIISHDKVDKATVPVKFLYNMFTPEELVILGEVFMTHKDTIIDNSEEIDVTETLTENKIKSYLIEMYEKQNESETSSDWDSDSQGSQQQGDGEDEILFADDRELEEIEKLADEEEELYMQQQQDQNNNQMEQEQQIRMDEEVQVQVIETFDPFVSQIILHTKTICQIIANPAIPNQFVSCSCDESFTIFDQEGKTIISKTGFQETVSLVAYSFDGKYLAIALLNGTIIVYNQDQTELKIDGPQSEPIFLEWHPKGYALLSGGEDATIWMWNAVNGSVLAVFAGHEGPITCGGFTTDGRMVVSASTDKTFRVWKPKTSEQAFKILGHGFHTDDVICYSQHVEQSIIVTGSNDRTCCLLNFDSGKILSKSQVLKAEIVSICFILTNHNVFACGDLQGHIYIINTQMRLLDTIKIGDQSISKILFEKKTNEFVASSLDGKIVHFDHRQSANIRVSQSPSSIYDFVIMGDSKVLVGCENGTMYIY